MLGKLDELIANIENADSVSVQLIPIELIETFERYYAPSIGKLMLQLKRRGVKFDFYEVPVRTYQKAFELVKQSETYEEKLIYSLKFLGLFNRVVSEGTEKFINTLTGKGE